MLPFRKKNSNVVLLLPCQVRCQQVKNLGSKSPKILSPTSYYYRLSIYLQTGTASLKNTGEQVTRDCFAASVMGGISLILAC